VAEEEPLVGIDVEFGADEALAVLAALGGDLADAVHHQHGRRRQLGVALAEHLAPRAGEQRFGVVGRKVGEIDRHRKVLGPE
jgi:hypothetical protein